MAEYDVVIVGGGSAGVAAAVSAARSGASTCLIEKYGFLGGQATSVQVGTICGLSEQTEDKEISCSQLAGAYANEFVDRINKICPNKFLTYKNLISFLPYESWAFEKVCRELIKVESITTFLHVTCIDAHITDRKIDDVTIFSHGNKKRIKGNAFVDATGEGVLSKLAKIPCLVDETYQAPGFVCHMIHIPLEYTSEEQLSYAIMSDLLQAESKVKVDLRDTRLSVVPGSFKDQSCMLKLALPFEREDSIESYTNTELFARDVLSDIFSYFKSYPGPFHGVRPIFSSTQCGLRTGPRGNGIYVLREEDVLGHKKFSSYIANGLWPIEVWRADRKPHMKYLSKNDYYQIPLECLISSDITNLYFAGRGISADSQAISSARVIGTALATGFAAGYFAHTKRTHKPDRSLVTKFQAEQFAV